MAAGKGADVKQLRDAVRDGVKFVSKKADVKEVEAFASSNMLRTMRICYATNVPSNGLEEAKSKEGFGIGIRITFKDGGMGFGKADADLTRAGAELAYQKAVLSKVHDPDYHGLPEPRGKPKIGNYHDKKMERISDEKAVALAYEALGGAFSELGKSAKLPNLNITGELNFLTEKMAIASSNGIDETDESTIAICTLTTILELESDISGMWFDSAASLSTFKPRNAGKTSAQKVLSVKGASRVESGNYDVVLGRQALADLLYSRLSVGLDSIDMKASPFVGKLGKKVAVEGLNITDDGLYKGAIGTKRVTDEGLPTGKTEIIKNGTLVNFLSNNYYARKFSDDARYNMQNGFRFGGGGRNYSSDSGISATNVVVGAGNFKKDSDLVREVKNGIYIGRIWYSYPVNGLASADFTSTIRGDSYIIKNGEISSGLIPNTCRINDNLERIFMNIKGIGKEQHATLAWAEDAVVITPEVAVKGVRIERIAKGLY